MSSKYCSPAVVTPLLYLCVCVCVCVCVCAKAVIQSFSNCKLQIPTFQLTAANHVFHVVWPCSGQSLAGLIISILAGCCQHTTAPALRSHPWSTKTHMSTCKPCHLTHCWPMHPWLPACVCVCQGINSNHAQTARFNIPKVLPLLQTMSSVFCPAGGLPCRAVRLRMYTCCQHTTAPGPANLTARQQDTHCMRVCPTAPHRPVCVRVRRTILQRDTSMGQVSSHTASRAHRPCQIRPDHQNAYVPGPGP